MCIKDSTQSIIPKMSVVNDSYIKKMSNGMVQQQ